MAVINGYTVPDTLEECQKQLAFRLREIAELERSRDDLQRVADEAVALIVQLRSGKPDDLTHLDCVELANLLKNCINREIEQDNKELAQAFINCLRAVVEVMRNRESVVKPREVGVPQGRVTRPDGG